LPVLYALSTDVVIHRLQRPQICWSVHFAWLDRVALGDDQKLHNHKVRG
jgi:hypothetical protein